MAFLVFGDIIQYSEANDLCLSRCDRVWESVPWAFAASRSGSGFCHILHLILKENLPYLRRASDAEQPTNWQEPIKCSYYVPDLH